MRDPLELSGKVVIVTGGSMGVGRGITTCFLDAGAEVVICDIEEPKEVPSVGDRRALFTPTDVCNVEQIGRAIAFTTERFGRLDVLVNNAGGTPFVDSATASPGFSESMIRLNLIAPLLFAQQANAVMQKQEQGGIIINIASVSAIRPSPGTAAYGAAKAGLLSLTQTLAVEWAPKVRMNAITAGMILTEKARLHYGNEEGVAAVAKTVPLGRLASPEDVGNTCLYLASPLASYLSGAQILMHGGGERPAYMAAAKGTSK